MPKSLQKFQSFISNKNIFIKHIALEKDVISFIIAFNEELQEYIIITLNDEYRLSKQDIDINADIFAVTPYNHKEVEEIRKEDYYINSKINPELMDDSQIIKDGISLSNYKEIVISKESTTDKTQYIQNTNQLEKFKECVKNIKYKLALFSQDYISFIDRSNDIKNYIIKNRENYLPVENIVLCICIDLQNLFENIDTFVEDSIKLYSSFYNILNLAHDKQIVALDSQVKLITDVPKQILMKKKDIEKIKLQLNTILENIYKLYKEEMKFIKLKQLEEMKRIKDVKDERVRDANVDKYTRELYKIQETKHKLQNNLSTIRKNYHYQLISFDYNVYKGLNLFKSMTDNMKKVL